MAIIATIIIIAVIIIKRWSANIEQCSPTAGSPVAAKMSAN